MWQVIIYVYSNLVLVLSSKEIIVKNIVFLCVLLFSVSAVQAADFKIGVVSVEKILSEAPQIEAFNSVMMEKFGDKKKELQELESKIKTMQENYKRNELVMTEDKLKELKRKIIGGAQAFKQKEVALGKEVQAMRTQELTILQQSIRDIINDIAKKGGYDIILSEGVAYTKDEFDLSGEVLKKMKEKFKDKKK
jgi:outer membrane protein